MTKRVSVFDRDMVDLCPPMKQADLAGFADVGRAGMVRDAASPAEAFAMLSEPQRRAAMIASATPPEICGPDMPISPARGAFAVFQPRRLASASGGMSVADGYRGTGEDRPRWALRDADVFDRMEADARRRHERSSEPDAPFVPPLSPGQVAMGRLYRDLVEDHDGKGMKCGSLEGSRGGGGSGAFIDTFVAQGIAIEKIRARIGHGVAMEVRRVRPSRRGSAAKGIIMDRALVDMVCLGDKSLSDVLAGHGWAKQTKHLASLRAALCAALDRMQGYRERRMQNVG